MVRDSVIYCIDVFYSDDADSVSCVLRVLQIMDRASMGSRMEAKRESTAVVPAIWGVTIAWRVKSTIALDLALCVESQLWKSMPAVFAEATVPLALGAWCHQLATITQMRLHTMQRSARSPQKPKTASECAW